VVDSGDILSRITNGYIPSTTHRVVNPAEGASGRFSMPFFMHPRPDAMLSVFPRFRQRGYPTPAADIVAGDFLAERLFDLGLA
jgi:isopenicillin N synthase-like dioxygenase